MTSTIICECKATKRDSRGMMLNNPIVRQHTCTNESKVTNQLTNNSSTQKSSKLKQKGLNTTSNITKESSLKTNNKKQGGEYIQTNKSRINENTSLNPTEEADVCLKYYVCLEHNGTVKTKTALSKKQSQKIENYLHRSKLKHHK